MVWKTFAHRIRNFISIVYVMCISSFTTLYEAGVMPNIVIYFRFFSIVSIGKSSKFYNKSFRTNDLIEFLQILCTFSNGWLQINSIIFHLNFCLAPTMLKGKTEKNQANEICHRSMPMRLCVLTTNVNVFTILTFPSIVRSFTGWTSN